MNPFGSFVGSLLKALFNPMPLIVACVCAILVTYLVILQKRKSGETELQKRFTPENTATILKKTKLSPILIGVIFLSSFIIILFFIATFQLI